MRLTESLIKLSQLLNTITCGPKGYSLCARFYENALDNGGVWWKVVRLVDKLFWFDKNHCRKSWMRRNK